MQLRTRETRTDKSKKRHSRLDVLNKDENMDYCFRPIKDIEDGGGQDAYGYEIVGSTNHKGETHALPFMKTKAKKVIRVHDTVLCKRNKDASAYFKTQEDEKYNSQIKLVQTVGKRTQAKLREADPNAIVEGGVEFTQAPGPTTGDTDGQ